MNPTVARSTIALVQVLALATSGASVCTLLCTVADGAATAIPLRLLTGVFRCLLSPFAATAPPSSPACSVWCG